MAAIYNCAGLFVDIEGVNCNVTLRHTLEEVPRTEELSSGRLTLATLITILKATMADFSDIVQTIKNSAMMPEDLPTRDPSEGETRVHAVSDPVCTIWGKVNGITVTVTSADKPFHALTCYYAMRELSGMATPQQQPPARQSAPPASAPEPERSESGTIEAGDFDNRDKDQYAAKWAGQRVAFNVYKIAREYGKARDGGPVTIYQLFANASHQWPAFRVYGDNEKAAGMVAEMEQMTANGDAVGKWRCVVYVNTKDGKARFYPVKLGADGDALEEQPF